MNAEIKPTEEVRSGDKCQIWTGAKSGNGYGVQSIAGKNYYVHRLVAARTHGEIAPGLVVAHKCDTPSCINPDHLMVCTQRENLDDMRRKGRAAAGETHRTRTHPELVLRGEQIGTAKLTSDDVIEIRSIYKKSLAGRSSETSLTAVAKRYGVSFQTVHKIIQRKSWTHL